MEIALPRACGRIGAAFALVVALGAAAPAPDTSAMESGGSGHVITAQGVIYQAAPVPDQDVDGPADSSNPTTTISPKLLSQKSLFQGDGYYYASSEQTTLDNRRAGVPGLGLSVPVK